KAQEVVMLMLSLEGFGVEDAPSNFLFETSCQNVRVWQCDNCELSRMSRQDLVRLSFMCGILYSIYLQTLGWALPKTRRTEDISYPGTGSIHRANSTIFFRSACYQRVFRRSAQEAV